MSAAPTKWSKRRKALPTAKQSLNAMLLATNSNASGSGRKDRNQQSPISKPEPKGRSTSLRNQPSSAKRPNRPSA